MKKEQGFTALEEFSISGVKGIIEAVLLKMIQSSNQIREIELNNFPSFSEYGLRQVAKIPTVKRLAMNLTEAIPETTLVEVRAQRPDMLIIRNIFKLTDEKDNGLRMPLRRVNNPRPKPKPAKKKK